MTAKTQSRRETIKARPRSNRTLDPTPIEIPAGRRTIPNTREMVRQSVQEALKQAGATGGYDTVEQMVQEETDLDPEDPDPPWTSRYEVTEMEDIPPDLPPLEEAQEELSEEAKKAETDNKKSSEKSEQQADTEKES